MRTFRRKLFAVASLLLLLCGCATKSSFDKMEDTNSKSKAAAAAYAADGFYFNRTPEREVSQWDFYYKNCELEERSQVYPKKTEWACAAPY